MNSNNGDSSFPGLGNLKNMNFQLPPQLANLSPEQLQQLKQQPQFQQILKTYMQRQMYQQQAAQGQVPHQPNSQPNSARINQPGLMLSMQAPRMGQPPMLAGLSQVPPQMGFGGVTGINNGTPGNFMGRPARPGAGIPGQPSINLAPPGSLVPPAAQALPGRSLSQTANMRAGRMAPEGSLSGASTARKPENIVPIQQFTNHPAVAPEVYNRIPFDALDSADKWSKSLEKDGKEVPVDLRIYEDMIKKDMKFNTRNSRNKDLNENLNESLLRDARSYNEIKQLRMGAISLSLKGQFNNSIWGEGYQGYGNGITNVATQLVLPADRKHNRLISRRTERDSNKDVIDRLNNEPTRHLVPIRLDIGELDNKYKLRDTFLWDLNEKDILVEEFVAMLLEDYKFIDRSLGLVIIKSIKDQIDDYNKKPEKPLGELRVPIKINITVNNTQYTDQFEWDILHFEDNDPEEFATVLCEEMSLPGEFATAIAHSIREQTQFFHKSLYLAGYGFDGLAIPEDEIRSHLLPSLRLMSDEPGPSYGKLVDDYFSILRNPSSVNDYTPTLIKLTQLEIERLDKELERESRHKRRQNNELQASGGRLSSRRAAAYIPRGGATLPDLSDTPKTFRTAQPSSVLPGGVDLGVPDVFTYNEVIVHKSNIPNPEYKPPQPKIKRVIFQNDQFNGRFLVKIKLPQQNQFPPQNPYAYREIPPQYM